MDLFVRQAPKATDPSGRSFKNQSKTGPKPTKIKKYIPLKPLFQERAIQSGGQKIVAALSSALSQVCNLARPTITFNHTLVEFCYLNCTRIERTLRFC